MRAEVRERSGIRREVIALYDATCVELGLPAHGT
jgi:hypothetical protein